MIMEKNKTFDIIAYVNVIRIMQDIILRLISCQLSLSVIYGQCEFSKKKKIYIYIYMASVRVETEGRNI